MSKKDKRKQQHHQPATKKSAAHKQEQAKPPQWLWIAGGALALALIIYGAWSLSRRTSAAAEPKGVEISVAQAYEKYKAGVFLLDVREKEEWEDFHAPNTTHIPLGELKNRLGELPKDQEIVVICRSGNRSQEGRDILLDGGFTNVSSMAGGLNEWKSAGYETVTGP